MPKISSSDLQGSMLTSAEGEEHISRADIEQSVRSLTKGASDTLKSTPIPPLAAGIFAGLMSTALAYLLGRRRGRRRATVLEIRRD